MAVAVKKALRNMQATITKSNLSGWMMWLQGVQL
jgi:hypothetical protein